MSELDPKGVEAAVQAFRASTFNALTLDECRDAATAAITAYLSTVSPLSDGDGWQPIETALRDGSRMLLWTGSAHVFTGKWDHDEDSPDEDFWSDDNGVWWEPHHWRPLPTLDPTHPRDEVAP